MRINSLPLFNRRRRRQTREYLSNEDYSWIWEPFKDAKDSKLAQTACLAAEIIANSSADKIPKVQHKLPPRIVIPLCAIALQKDLNLNNINGLNIQEFSSIEDAINYFLEKTQPSPLWRYLFNSLPTQLQYNLCYRLSNYRLPNKNDWRNLFKNNSYQFNTSLHYAFIIAILLVISLIAMIGMYSFIRLYLNSSLNLLVFWSFITMISFWFSWGKYGFKFKSLGHIKLHKYFINLIGILALIVFVLRPSFDIFILISNLNWFSFKTSFLNMFENKSIVSYLSIYALDLINIICSILVIEPIDYPSLLIIWLFIGVILGTIISIIISIIIGGIIGIIISIIICTIMPMIIVLITGEYFELIIGIIISIILGGIIGIIIGEDIGGIIGIYIGCYIGMYIGRFIRIMIKIVKPLFISTLVLSSFLSTLYFVHYTLINLLSLGWIEILLFWLTTLGVVGTLYCRGKTLDYEARNPLKGILDNTINN